MNNSVVDNLRKRLGEGSVGDSKYYDIKNLLNGCLEVSNWNEDHGRWFKFSVVSYEVEDNGQKYHFEFSEDIVDAVDADDVIQNEHYYELIELVG